MGKRDKRVSTEGGQGLGSNPFEDLDLGALPAAASPVASSPNLPVESTRAKESRGRIEVRREKSGRGGKTVTVLSGFVGISAEEKSALAKTIRKRCGVGGAVKAGAIEIQGDKRQEAVTVLEEAGFRPVLAGG